MGRVREYSEEDGFVLTFKFFDDGVAATPDTIRYRIECLTTRRTVRDWTTVSPAHEIQIVVTPDDNAILNQRSIEERKQLIVQSNYGTDTQKSTKSEWIVENLQGVT